VRGAARARAATSPPALPGLPLVGNLLDYRRDHVDVFWRGYRALGPIFSIRLGPQRAVVLVGPEHHRFFFTQVDRILSMPEVYRFVIPMFGPVVNAEPELEVRRRQLALLHSAFRGERMTHHVDVMVDEISSWLDGFGAGGVFEVYDSLSELAMRIAARAFMADELRDRIDEIRPLYEDLARGMEFVLPPNLPLPRFRRRDRARGRLHELMRPVIAQRRLAGGGHEDFLQTLVDGRFLAGQASDDLVVGLALLSVFTAYITTAAQACWTLVQLLQHPDYLAVVRAEQEEELDGDGDISPDALRRLVRLEWALKESQRMHPVMSHYARYNAEAYEAGGYLVPRGWLTMVCPAIAHRLPSVFASPERYDPWRFSPERAEDRQPYSLIGFGAGLYRCPGAAFGTSEIKCILSLLLRRFTLELLDRAPSRDYEMGVIRPSPPCRIAYRRMSGRRRLHELGKAGEASGRT
jgi:sterol 14alpha-demethylase